MIRFFWNVWRPHGDSNPGYRRERAFILINILKKLIRKYADFLLIQTRQQGNHIRKIIRRQMNVFLRYPCITMPQ